MNSSIEAFQSRYLADAAYNADDLWKFWLCWKRQACDGCLVVKDNVSCSWCPFSSTCVPSPNPNFPILAPIQKSDICPMGSQERWELRSRPFGCQVSTTSVLTAVGAVFSTLAFIAIISLLVLISKWMTRWCKSRRRKSGRGRTVVIFFPWSLRRRRRGVGQGEQREEAFYEQETSPLLG